MKKKLMEHIIDDMAEEQRLKEEAIKAREAKKEARKDIKKDARSSKKKGTTAKKSSHATPKKRTQDGHASAHYAKKRK